MSVLPLRTDIEGDTINVRVRPRTDIGSDMILPVSLTRGTPPCEKCLSPGGDRTNIESGLINGAGQRISVLLGR